MSKLTLNVLSFGYKVKKGNKKSNWLVICKDVTYLIFKGGLTGAWIITCSKSIKPVNQTGTLRDAIIHCLQRESLV